MKPFYWGVILASVVIAASIWLIKFGTLGKQNAVPALIENSTPLEEENQKPQIPDLDAFKGLEQEKNSLDRNLAPLKN